MAGIVVLILALDWLSMLFAEAILRWCGVLLQHIGVVLGRRKHPQVIVDEFIVG